MKKFLAMCFVLMFVLVLVPNAPFKPKEPLPAKPLAYAQEEVVEEAPQEEVEETKESGLIEYYSDQTRLCVVGEASKILTPNRGVVQAYANGFGKDCNEAKENVFKVFDNAVASLEENGCDKGQIVIESFRCRPCRECHDKGCHGSLIFSFVIEDLTKTDDVISNLLDSGVKEISSICYEVSNMEEEYNSLLSEALENARNKAVKLLGEDSQLIDVREQSVYYSNCIYKEYIENQNDYLGGIEVRTRVEATFV